MPESDASTLELSPCQVFAGRVRPVVGSDPRLDDPTAVREWSWLTGPDPKRPARVSLGVRVGVFVLLAVPAMLVVALAMALAAR
jgi:hypothetical protein